MTLSVIMPVYNGAAHLREAIDSILQQSFTDFEFIIIDDGSTDNSAAIIESYSDPRIVFLRNNTNEGISACLNKGTISATADLIARMDADDISYPERLERQLKFITAHPDGALWSCYVQVVTENKETVKVETFNPDYYYFNLIFECWIYHPSIVFRKQAIEQVGGYTVPFAEDYEMIWQVSRRFKMYHQPEVLLNYRLSHQSLHRVLKKDEYERAFSQMVVRNIRFYMGDDFSIPDAEIRLLRHNFSDPITGKPAHIAHGLKILGEIAQKACVVPNVNCQPAKVLQAAKHKRNYILDYYLRSLPRTAALVLTVRTGCWNLLFKIGQSHLSRKFRKDFG